MNASFKLLLTGLCLLLIGGCGQRREGSAINWTPTLSPVDKNPYGSYLAYASLPHYFPGARITALSRDFKYSGISDRMGANSGDSAQLLILSGFNFEINDREWNALLNFLDGGNEVLLFSSSIDDKITQGLRFTHRRVGSEFAPPNELEEGRRNIGVLQLATDSSRSYGFAGRSIRSYFDLPETDTAVHETLSEESDDEPEDDSGEDSLYTFEKNSEGGYDAIPVNDTDIAVDETGEFEEVYADYPVLRPEVLGHAKEHPNFIRYSVGRGHLTIHAAPLVLSNYFLLQPGNRQYLDGIWHSLPANVSAVYWAPYYNHSNRDTDLGVIWGHPATRTALLIGIGLLLLYVLFGLRRMQRIVPRLPPLQNTSVSFVETIGKLYYNKHDHANLAGKMIQHFFDWVRSRYHLETGQLNETFAAALAAKSGRPTAEVQDLLDRIDRQRNGSTMSERELYELHHAIQSFYNHPTA